MSNLTFDGRRRAMPRSRWSDARRGQDPPLSTAARIEAGVLLRRLQRGEMLSMPHSRPVPSIGTRRHELGVNDAQATWRIVHHLDSDAIVICEVFSKKTPARPAAVVRACQLRLRDYDDAVGAER